MARTTNIQKRKRLSALYEKGGEVRFNADGVNNGDPIDDDIVIFVTPPSPLQRDMCVREAQAARSRLVLSAKNQDSVEGQNARVFVSDMTDDELHNYVIALGEPERQAEAQRRVLAKDEWKNFNELRDLVRQWEEEKFPTGEEWDPLIARDRAFGSQIDEALVEIREADLESLKMQGREELEKKALSRRNEVQGTAEFMRVFENYMLYYSCRDNEDHKALFFDSANEILEYPEFISEALHDALNKFINGAEEAKN